MSRAGLATQLLDQGAQSIDANSLQSTHRLGRQLPRTISPRAAWPKMRAVPWPEQFPSHPSHTEVLSRNPRSFELSATTGAFNALSLPTRVVAAPPPPPPPPPPSIGKLESRAGKARLSPGRPSTIVQIGDRVIIPEAATGRPPALSRCRHPLRPPGPAAAGGRGAPDRLRQGPPVFPTT